MKIIVMNCSKSKAQRAAEDQEHESIIARLTNHTAAGRKLAELRQIVSCSFSKVDVTLLKYRKYRILVAVGYAIFLTMLPGAPAMAASGGDGGVAILKLMQQASFWVGLCVVVWGIVEAQLDLPGWKGRIVKGIGGYIAILLVPMLFIALRENLQIDVWNKLSK